MDEQLHLCEWKGQLWPVKIVEVPQNSRRKDTVKVEILGEEKRLLRRRGDMSPLTEQRIEAMSVQLGPGSTRVKDPTEELKYRKALRLALNILSMRRGLSSPIEGSPRRSFRLSLNLSSSSASPPLAKMQVCKQEGTKKQMSDADKMATCASLGNGQASMQASAKVPKANRHRKANALRRDAHLPTGCSTQPGSPSSPTAPPEERPGNKVDMATDGLTSGKRAGESGGLACGDNRDKSARATGRKNKSNPEKPSEDMCKDGRAKRRRAAEQATQDDSKVAPDSSTEAPKGHKCAKTAATPTKANPTKSNGPATRGPVKEAARSPRSLLRTDKMVTSSPCLSSSGLGPLASTPKSCTRRVRFSPRHLLSDTPATESTSTPRRRAVTRKCQLFTSSCTNLKPSQAFVPEPVPGRTKSRAIGRQRRAQSEGRAEEESQVQHWHLGTPHSESALLEGGYIDLESSGTESPDRGAVGIWMTSFNRLQPDTLEQGTEETAMSSDLSIELSPQEDPTSLDSSLEQEEGEDPEEEELPSLLLRMDNKCLSIKEGNCVWCKFRHFPYWPAVVKAVNRKQRKASVIFIDDALLDQKRSHKAFSVSMRNLKPINCELTDQLESKAKEKYSSVITWGLELIHDYRIRIACGSFSGSFMDYFAEDISGPVRKTYLKSSSDISCPSNLITEEHISLNESEDFSFKQQRARVSKKLLPDRSKAARNLANEKLVRFIVDKRGVEEHLQAVISGQISSKRLMALLKTNRSVDQCNTYLEDETQVDQVYRYLEETYKNATRTAPCLAKVDVVRLILDVLFPEAVVHAIAGVDKISLEKAEDKFLEGPLLSKREKEDFDMIIAEQMRSKAIPQCPAS